MTDEWVRLDAPPPMPKFGQEVEIKLGHFVVKAVYEGRGRFSYEGGACWTSAHLGGSVVAWRRKR